MTQLDKCIAILRQFANQEQGEGDPQAAAAADVQPEEILSNLQQVRSNAGKLCLELGKFSEVFCYIPFSSQLSAGRGTLRRCFGRK